MEGKKGQLPFQLAAPSGLAIRTTKLGLLIALSRRRAAASYAKPTRQVNDTVNLTVPRNRGAPHHPLRVFTEPDMSSQDGM